MAKKLFSPRKIYIQKGSLDFPHTERILRNLDQIPVEIIDNSQDLIAQFRKSRDVIGEGKKHLLIKHQKGKFIKPCPCTPFYIGCNYYVINLDLNCPLDCTYCILQQYLTNPLITVHINLEDLWNELDEFLFVNRKKVLRIGTGELGDSLVLDHITENSVDLISYFKNKKNVWFELKTKTVNLKNVLETGPANNVVVSWSLNSEKIAQELEKGAPSIKARIQAAAAVAKNGFWVGFHFDPLIFYPGWEDGYFEVIERLFQAIDPKRIAWISLGSLRYPPALKAIIKERFSQTEIMSSEFIKGRDGKLRYFKPHRLGLYKKIVNFIHQESREKIPLYFCMESVDIWMKVMGWIPEGQEDLGCYLSLPPPHLKE